MLVSGVLRYRDVEIISKKLEKNIVWAHCTVVLLASSSVKFKIKGFERFGVKGKHFLIIDPEKGKKLNNNI